MIERNENPGADRQTAQFNVAAGPHNSFERHVEAVAALQGWMSRKKPRAGRDGQG